MKKSPASMKKNSAFTLRSGNRVSPMQLSGVQSPMRKEKRKRTVEYTQDSETGDITKKITRKSGATVTKTYKGGERRASKVVRDNKYRTRTVTGKGLDKEIDVKYKKGGGDYKTTPRQNIKNFKEGVGHVIGGGATIAALASVAPGLAATKTKAMLGKATVAGIKAGVGGLAAIGVRDAVKGVKNRVKKIKQNIKSKRQQKRESKVKKA